MSYRPKDSELTSCHFDGVAVELILPEVRTDRLPDDDIEVPEWELPACDQDGEHTAESIKVG